MASTSGFEIGEMPEIDFTVLQEMQVVDGTYMDGVLAYSAVEEGEAEGLELYTPEEDLDRLLSKVTQPDETLDSLCRALSLLQCCDRLRDYSGAMERLVLDDVLLLADILGIGSHLSESVRVVYASGEGEGYDTVYLSMKGGIELCVSYQETRLPDDSSDEGETFQVVDSIDLIFNWSGEQREIISHSYGEQ